MLLALYASIVLILIAGDALLFLLAWEVMSILCYLLVVSAPGGENGQVESAYLLLAMGEAGTLAAAVGFLLLALGASSLQFDALKFGASGLDTSVRGAVILLTFFGFGVKAGLAPVNSWLPRAYRAAPRAFAPVLAGGDAATSACTASCVLTPICCRSPKQVWAKSHSSSALFPRCSGYSTRPPTTI